VSRWKPFKRPVYREGPKTFWNGTEAKCARVRVVVGAAPPGWWCHGLENTVRQAVRVVVDGGRPFYLDDEDGLGWLKVTTHVGSPRIAHRSLPVSHEVTP
jgi:hypothetical protein